MDLRQRILSSITEDQKKKFVSDDIMYICLAWNRYAPMKHSVFSRSMQATVFEALKDYDVDIIVGAIMKYGAVLSEPGKYWWTAGGYLLQGFLTKDSGSILTRFVDTTLKEFEKQIKPTYTNTLLKRI